MENEPSTPPNPRTLAERLAAASQQRPTDTEALGSNNIVAEDNAVSETTIPPDGDGEDAGLGLLDEETRSDSADSQVSGSGKRTASQEIRIAKHSFGAARAEIISGALGVTTKLSKKLDDAAERHVAARQAEPGRTKKIPLMPSSDIAIVKHLLLAGRADENLDSKIWADRHGRLFGDAEEDKTYRQENGIMTRKERRKAVRSIKIAALLGRISIPESRQQISATLAIPLDLGEHMRNHGKTTTQKIVERHDRAHGALMEQRAKIRAVTETDRDEENSTPNTSGSEKLDTVTAGEVLAEMYGLRHAGLSDHEIEDELARSYPPERSKLDKMKMDFILARLDDKATRDNPGWFEYSRHYLPDPTLEKKLGRLSRAEIKQLSDELPLLISQNQQAATQALGRDLSRQERAALSVKTRLEFVKQFTGTTVTWQDMDQFQTFLFQHQEAKLPQRNRGRQDNQERNKAKSNIDYAAVARSLPESIKQQLLDIDEEVYDEIQDRKGGWGTLTPAQEKAKYEEVRDEVYGRHTDITGSWTHAETLAIIKELNAGT